MNGGVGGGAGAEALPGAGFPFPPVLSILSHPTRFPLNAAENTGVKAGDGCMSPVKSKVLFLFSLFILKIVLARQRLSCNQQESLEVQGCQFQPPWDMWKARLI